MFDVTVMFSVQNSHLNPVEINIIYNDDGSVNQIDWREAVLSYLDDIAEEEYNSEDDPDYVLGIETDGEEFDGEGGAVVAGDICGAFEGFGVELASEDFRGSHECALMAGF